MERIRPSLSLKCFSSLGTSRRRTQLQLARSKSRSWKCTRFKRLPAAEQTVYPLAPPPRAVCGLLSQLRDDERQKERERERDDDDVELAAHNFFTFFSLYFPFALDEFKLDLLQRGA